MNHFVSRLAQTSLFANADSDALCALANAGTLQRVPAGAHLFHSGESASAFFWLESGDMHLYRLTFDGEEKVFQIVGAGNLIAETSMFTEPGHYPLSALAESDCRLYRLPRQQLLDMVQSSPELAMKLLSTMSTRLYQAINRIDQLTTNNASQRLVLYLIDMYNQQHTRWLTLPVGMNVLARQLGIAPETLSRQVQRFKQNGLLSGQRKEWVLLDLDGLCKSVGLPSTVTHQEHGMLDSCLFGCCNFS